MSWTTVAPEIPDRTQHTKLVTLSGKLYAVGQDERLLEWDGVSSWVIKSGVIPFLSDFLFDATVHNGKIYVISGVNHLYEWDGVSAWVERTTNDIFGTSWENIISFNGNIYAGIRELWESVALGEFTLVASSIGEDYNSMAVFNNKLYMGSASGVLYEWDGVSSWVLKAPTNPSAEAISELLVHQNELYGITATSGYLLKWNGSNAWVIQNPTPSASLLSAGVVFNDTIYAGAGSLTGSKLFKFVSGNWTEVHAASPDVSSIQSLAVLGTKLYGAGI